MSVKNVNNFIIWQSNAFNKLFSYFKHLVIIINIVLAAKSELNVFTLNKII